MSTTSPGYSESSVGRLASNGYRTTARSAPPRPAPYAPPAPLRSSNGAEQKDAGNEPVRPLTDPSHQPSGSPRLMTSTTSPAAKLRSPGCAPAKLSRALTHS